MDNQKGLIIGTLIGSAVGAAVAVLTTPKSGPELRSDINEQLEYGKLKAEDAAILLKERMEAFTEIIEESSSNLSETVVEEANQIVHEVKRALELLREQDDLDATEIKKLVKSVI
ncbi:YtxH domain-containing protein [Anaerobacillus sp. CMMVII]|uniref:YtxH domain-containing protein n=1 Tax=Anaerobacillus sp. CMMVII TaxID=2755588 RepID=UPI0021B7AE18|nr:YtxH domain-containing protein [Anaerobacillus sp. CMMVII]MCT8138216.1 YtxH domain-containing protein [Anaerobacillus sp. CMMVII]